MEGVRQCGCTTSFTVDESFTDVAVLDMMELYGWKTSEEMQKKCECAAQCVDYIDWLGKDKLKTCSHCQYCTYCKR